MIPACIVRVKKNILGKYHIAYDLVQPSGDSVFVGDHSPPIGSYKFNKPIQADGKMHVTYALFLQQGQKFIDIPNTHNITVAVNEAFSCWELFGNIKFDRIPYVPNNPIDITIALNNTDPMFKPSVGQTVSDVMARTYYPQTDNDPSIFTSVYNTDYLWSLDGKMNFANNINQTLRHELSHAWGGVHTSNPNDIMYPYYHNSLRPTAMDVYQCQICCGIRTPPVNPIEIDGFFNYDSRLLEFNLDPIPKA